MKVPANQTTIDTIQQYEKIVRFSNQELKLTVNGIHALNLRLIDDVMLYEYDIDEQHEEVELDHDGMFDLVVERVSTQDITNLIFW